MKYGTASYDIIEYDKKVESKEDWMTDKGVGWK